MHEPLPDKIMRSDRDSVRGPRDAAPMEREVRFDAGRTSAELIRERVDGGFYHTPAVADVVARQIIATGDL